MGLQISHLHVRRSAFIAASPERIWREFESFEGICSWLNLGHAIHTFETKPAGRVRMSVVIEGERHGFGGSVIVWEPGRELSFTSQWDGTFAWPQPTLWTIRLTALYDGTLVEILHHGFERAGVDAGEQLESYESGWDNKHLMALRRIVEG
jgi:uncharacterized protein YndB with AHSA1/START domain